MKNKLFIIILILLTVSGCSAELDTESELFNEYQVLSGKHTALQNEFNVLQFNYENLKEVKAERDACREEYNALAGEFTALQTELAILKVHYQSVSDQYNVLATGFSTTQMDTDEALELLNERYKELVERHKEVDAQIKAVRDKKVELLSDNLTGSEYKAFYKGWELWWDTFN